MQDRNKKLGLGVAALVVVLGLVAVLVNTQKMSEPSDELMGSADDELTVEEIGPPPSLVIDPDVDLSGALTADGNFYQFERNQALPDPADLTRSTQRETWTPLVFDKEYDSIVEFLEENTDVTNQLTLAVVWDEEDQDWNVYPNEIFRSDYNIDTLNIFSEDFDGTLIFNTSRAYDYADHIETRVGDFDVERGWNYGPKPDFDELDGKAVVFWTGDVTGNAVRLTPSGDLNDPIDKDFFDDLDDDEVYWFYVKGTVVDSCDDNEAYVCGVDGNTYLNSCVADEEDVTVDYVGQCKNDRTALRGRLEDDTLELDDTLVLEFFTSNSDNSPEDIDVDLDEIDLDDNDSGLAIYEIDGARFNFVTAFEDADLDVNDDSIEIDLDNNLVAGEYQLRIFDTFEREKFEELELDFEVIESTTPVEIVDFEYDLVDVTERTLELELQGDLDGRNFSESEFENYFSLIDVESGNEVTFTDFSMDSDENVTITLPTSTLSFENMNEGYRLEIEEATDESEGWKLLAKNISVKGVEAYSEMDGKTVSPTGYDESLVVELRLLGLETIKADLVEEFDWISVEDGEGDLTLGTDYEIVEDGDNNGEYDMTFNIVGRSWSLPVDIDADFYYLGDGLYVPVQGMVRVEAQSGDDDNEVISLNYTYDVIETEYTLSGAATGRRNVAVLTPSVDPLDMTEVDLAEIEDAFEITSNYEGGQAVDVDQCTISMGADKKIRIECPQIFGGQLVVEWGEVVNQADGYRLEAGSLSDFSEAG
jgi:hypothetical protein